MDMDRSRSLGRMDGRMDNMNWNMYRNMDGMERLNRMDRMDRMDMNWMEKMFGDMFWWMWTPFYRMFDYDNNYYDDHEAPGWYGPANDMDRMDCMDMNQMDRMECKDMNGRTQRHVRSRSNSICRVQSFNYDY